MVDTAEFLCSLFCLLTRLLQVLRKYLSMVLHSNSSTSAVSSSPSLSSSWKRVAELPVVAANKRPKESSSDRRRVHPVLAEEVEVTGSDASVSVSVERVDEENKKEAEVKCCEEKLAVVAKERRRPARIVIPKPVEDAGFGVVEKEKEGEEEVMEVDGGDYCLASRRGSRHMMEDAYGIMANINGDSKQAFFGVFDGHGGRAAVDFVSEKLGKNILSALDELSKTNQENQTQLAIKAGYLTTDRDFLAQGVSSGACAATVLVKEGELHAANVGDCRVVMSRNGVAEALTEDHRAAREDERERIENSGGLMTCRNGVWRVHGSLAVSRAIGDLSMKQWIISEPDTKRIHLTPDCEFLILASDGLWDKVTNQEAVDVISKQSNCTKSCKELIEMSCRRGNRDDITVMVIHLEKFMHCSSG
ncbi:putative protein phosphatase 2C 74 [Canna indica]|uniref:protein-serine/threonine phosphatase n=1 Tax=Canna indica TaxID=4628 RepID=A0AAQ3K440_9LILI|nr:putative protein phosphatase 2C 74 [Canna indica]